MAGEMWKLAGTPLGQAIREDDLDMLKKLLQKGENSLFMDRKGNTYLHYIATMYSPKVFHRLVATGIDVNAVNKHRNSALHVCALHHESGHVMDLMASGVDPLLSNGMGLKAHEIGGVTIWWRSLQNFYMPGLFNAIYDHDLPKVEFLLKNWCRVDTKMNKLTARQYAAKLGFHDIVALVDRYKTSLDFVYGVLEDDRAKVMQSASRFNCDFNLVRETHLKTHPLQVAVQLGNLDYATWMCHQTIPEMKMADVNSPVHIQGYFKGPLYFEVLTLNRPGPERQSFLDVLLASSPDLSLRDERGRSFLHLALDRLPEEEALELVVRCVKHLGANLADRDCTGLTIRNMAELYQMKSVLQFIDREIVRLIRENDISALSQLSLYGYDDFFFELDQRDLSVYAGANETDDATNFLTWFEKSQTAIQKLHAMIADESVDAYDIYCFLDQIGEGERDGNRMAPSPDFYARWKDKGGRNCAHLAILHSRLDVLDILSYFPGLLSDLLLTSEGLDNKRRSPLHYAFCHGSDSPFAHQLIRDCDDPSAAVEKRDVHWRCPYDYAEPENAFLEDELKASYGLELELYFLRKYDVIRALILDEDTDMTEKERLKALRELLKTMGHSVEEIHKKLRPNDIPLSIGYEPLGEVCLLQKAWSFLRCLVHYGLDADRNVTLNDPSNTQPITMSVRDHCSRLGRTEIVNYIDRRKFEISHRAQTGAEMKDDW